MAAATLTGRIEQRLRELGITARAASLKVSTNPELVRGVLRAGGDANPTDLTVRKLAQALEVTEAWLRGESDVPQPVPPRDAEFRLAPDIRFPALAAMPKDVPVWGTARGSLLDDFEGINLFSGQAVDWVRRPPALANVPDAYAIYVAGDSMWPMHPEGELRFVNPHRPATPGDSVIVMTRNWEHDPGQGYIKLLRRRKAGAVLLAQLNPEAEIEIPARYVVTIHRVLSMNELFGI